MNEVTVKNPSTGENLYVISDYSEEGVAVVYRNAWQAFETVKSMPLHRRLALIRKLKQVLVDKKEWVVDRICEETGKSRTDALVTEIYPSLDLLAYYEKTAEKTLRDRRVPTPLVLIGKQSRIFHEPLGPVLIISPWNYPFDLSFQMITSAFIAGNSVLLKPSDYAPLRGVFEELFEAAGFSKNAVQVVYGGRVTGSRLIDGKPRKIFFTGSVAAGKKVMAQAAEHLIPVVLELGGKDPMVVFDDVNLERTVNGALWGGLVNSGQTCTGIERIYVQEGIYDPFVAMLKEKAQRIKTRANTGGKPDIGDIEMGYMTTDFQVNTVEEHVAEARRLGARIVTGGDWKGHSRALSPTIITVVDSSMRVQSEETFGPVITVSKFRTEEEAIRLANDSPFGLSASVWTRDLDRAKRVARAIVTGNVSINNVLATQATGALPFGGAKESGFGQYKGETGLLAFCNMKSVVIDRQSGRIELNWYPYGKEKYALIGRLIENVFAGGPLSLLKTALTGLRLEIHSRRHRI